MTGDTGAEAAIRALVTEFTDALTRRDVDAVLATIAPDAFLIGTGADEEWRGHAGMRVQFERDWAQSDTASMRFDVHHVGAAGPVAWVAAHVHIHAVVQG